MFVGGYPRLVFLLLDVLCVFLSLTLCVASSAFETRPREPMVIGCYYCLLNIFFLIIASKAFNDSFSLPCFKMNPNFATFLHFLLQAIFSCSITSSMPPLSLKRIRFSGGRNSSFVPHSSFAQNVFLHCTVSWFTMSDQGCGRLQVWQII